MVVAQIRDETTGIEKDLVGRRKNDFPYIVSANNPNHIYRLICKSKLALFLNNYLL